MDRQSVPAEATIDRVRGLAEARGHAVDNAREALRILEAAFAAGTLLPTPEVDAALADLRVSLAQDEGQRLGGKSAEASRFILRAIVRMLQAPGDGPPD